MRGPRTIISCYNISNDSTDDIPILVNVDAVDDVINAGEHLTVAKIHFLDNKHSGTFRDDNETFGNRSHNKPLQIYLDKLDDAVENENSTMLERFGIDETTNDNSSRDEVKKKKIWNRKQRQTHKQSQQRMTDT